MAHYLSLIDKVVTTAQQTENADSNQQRDEGEMKLQLITERSQQIALWQGNSKFTV